MFRSSIALVAGLAVGAWASAAHGVVLAPSSGVTSFAVLDAGVSNPFAGGTLLQTVTSGPQTLTGVSNINHQSIRRATVSLTTQVYQLTAGSLGFAYTINAQSFGDPLDPLDFAQVLIPRLTVPGFDTAVVDVNVSRIPSDYFAAPYTMTVYRPVTNNDNVVYSFADDTVPANVPAFFSLVANGTITAFAETKAPAFQSSQALVQLVLRDARQPGTGMFTDFSFESLAPNFGEAGEAVPEPMALATLPLALGALGLRLRRSAGR
jgi:hypothetical protein